MVHFCVQPFNRKGTIGYLLNRRYREDGCMTPTHPHLQSKGAPRGNYNPCSCCPKDRVRKPVQRLCSMAKMKRDTPVIHLGAPGRAKACSSDISHWQSDFGLANLLTASIALGKCMHDQISYHRGQKDQLEESVDSASACRERQRSQTQMMTHPCDQQHRDLDL